MELFQQASCGIRKFRLAPFFGAICAAIAIPWAPWQYIVIWYALLLLHRILLKATHRRLSANMKQPQHLTKIWLQMLAVEIPTQLIWLLYVPLCWKAGDLSNNAFLLLYMLAAVSVTMRIYGPCIYLALPALLLYLPFFAVYTLHSGTYMDIVMAAAQVSYLGLLTAFGFNQYRMFTKMARQQLTIKSLARDLTRARDVFEQESQAKSAFLASMSHELRTPMNAIIGFSDMIRQAVLGPITPPKYQEYAEDIYASGQHLLALINDILDLSKIEAGKRDLTDGRIVMSEMAMDTIRYVELQAEKKSIKIRSQITSDLVLIADERALRQVLVNLLSNAIKFSATGGTVTLFVRRTAERRLAVGVSDNGVGMDEDGMRKALEPYGQVQQTTKANGTGLGLPIAKALIEAHGASFHIQSAVGVGTSVWGEFPRSRLQEKAA